MQPVMFIHQKLLKCYYTDNVMDTVFFIMDTDFFTVFFFWFYGSFGFEGNIKCAKNGIKSVMELPDVFRFHVCYMTNNINKILFAIRSLVWSQKFSQKKNKTQCSSETLFHGKVILEHM